MLAEHIEVIDVDARHWRNLLRLGREGRPPRPRARAVLIVENDERTLKAWHSERGVMPGWQRPREVPLAALRAALDADRVTVVQEHALRDAIARGEQSMPFDEEYLTQILHLYEGFRLTVADGGIVRDPPLVLPRVTPERLRRALRLLPDGRCFVLYVFDEDAGELWTSFVLRKRAGVFDLLTTHEALRPLPFTDPAADAPRIVAEVAQRFAPVAAGLFMPLAALRRINAAPRRISAFYDEYRAGRLRLAPCPWTWRAGLRLGRLFGRW